MEDAPVEFLLERGIDVGIHRFLFVGFDPHGKKEAPLYMIKAALLLELNPARREDRARDVAPFMSSKLLKRWDMVTQERQAVPEASMDSLVVICQLIQPLRIIQEVLGKAPDPIPVLPGTHLYEVFLQVGLEIRPHLGRTSFMPAAPSIRSKVRAS